MIFENSYGDVSRLNFISESIARNRSLSVLDIGCGTGQRLTAQLAERFPATSFLGIDVDPASIAFAAAEYRSLANLRFQRIEDLGASLRFDLIIASEVIEHVEDPAEFLRFLRLHAANDGKIIITLPNGYGPFELMALTEVLLNLSGLQAVVRRLKYALVGRQPNPPTADTLAVSPHVNFFSHRGLLRLFAEAGLAVGRERNRSILCGYIIDDLLMSRRLIEWNAANADYLPRWCVSDWMFELEAHEAPRSLKWRRNAWGRFRRALNLRRWGLS